QHLLAGRAVDRQIFPVVGYGHVLVAAGHRGSHHLLQGGAAVAGAGGVVVEVAADVLQLDEVGQLSGGRRLDLARVLPERRRDPGKVQGGVDRFLGLGGDGGAVFEQPVLVQEPPSVDGALAQGDVVGFRAGEVEDGSAEVLGGDGADV